MVNTIFGALGSATTAGPSSDFFVAGRTFQITSTTTLEVGDGADGTVYSGDATTNQVPDDPTQVLISSGEAFWWDFTFEVTDGVSTYEIGYFSHDANGSGAVDPGLSADPAGGEYSYFMGFIGGAPPLNTTLTVNGIVDNGASIPISSFVCFVLGTSIKTQSGEVPIETLSKGDMVLTLDNGYQPIRWIGSSKRAATGDLAPILIRKGALGNDRDLRVSPQHRMLLQGWQAELLFGETEVLATAKSLINDHSIIRVEGGDVEYFHMLFDTHEIVWAEGAPSESFHPGEQGWNSFDQATRDEILELFPQLDDKNFESYGPSARLSLKHKEGALLGAHMVDMLEVKTSH